MSADTPRKEMLLRTMLIGSLSKLLAEKLTGQDDGSDGGKQDSDCPYGDYGDYGSDDDYGTEDIGNARRAFGNEIDFGMGAGMGQGGVGSRIVIRKCAIDMCARLVNN